MFRLLLPLLLLLSPLAAQATVVTPSQLVPAAPREVTQRWLAENAAYIGPGEAAARARAVYGGRVLAVRRTDGGRVYRVRLLMGGQVRIVLVDARSGRVLR